MAGEQTLVPLLFDAWDDLERAYAGMTAEEATARPDGASAFGWTLRHLIGGFDFYVNELTRGRARHPTFAREHAEYEFSGDCGDWDAIAEAAREVLAEAKTYLSGMSDAELAETIVPGWEGYPATTLRYMLLRTVTHTYYHIGEVATRRGREQDFPGEMASVFEGPNQGTEG
jgi:uncharacterized damage-inducible protein DinB